MLQEGTRRSDSGPRKATSPPLSFTQLPEQGLTQSRGEFETQRRPAPGAQYHLWEASLSSAPTAALPSPGVRQQPGWTTQPGRWRGAACVQLVLMATLPSYWCYKPGLCPESSDPCSVASRTPSQLKGVGPALSLPAPVTCTSYPLPSPPHL